MNVISKFRKFPLADKFIIVVSLVCLVLASLTVSSIVKSRYFSSIPQDLVIQPAHGSEQQNTVPVSTSHPSKIQIPSLGLALEIRDGIYDVQKNTWTLGDSYAYFATSTSSPNDKTGRTFIYGHARPNIFLDLFKINKGDKAYVTVQNGQVYEYAFTDSYTTNPADIDAMNPTDEPTLTIQTCSGFRFQNRTMFNFKLEAPPEKTI